MSENLCFTRELAARIRRRDLSPVSSERVRPWRDSYDVLAAANVGQGKVG